MPTQQKLQFALDLWDVLSLMFMAAFFACPIIYRITNKARRNALRQ